ncbi:MAG: hypothetical protein ACTHMS_00680 [Jatrophihabitans sp.]|uniref:hypothetical protein n=1 Tax=Jatrophihabitans sp. TaxID=1932789 RepID=UPI003F7D3BC7
MPFELTAPSATFPAPPACSVTVPDDWEPVLLPGASVAARQSGTDGTFAANVVIAVDRSSVAWSVDDALLLLRRDLGPGARLDEPAAVSIGEREFVLVNAAFDHPELGTLVQAHAYTSVPVNEQVKDVVHVVGTCTADRRAEEYPLVQGVMNSVRLLPG